MRDRMLEALKTSVVPELRKRGFRGTFPHFRRLTATRIHLLSFQFDKWGGGFVIEIANSAPEGFTTHWGKFVAPKALTAQHLHPDKRKRIQAKDAPDSAADDWFRYDDARESDIYQNICKAVLDKMDVVEEFWKNGVL